MATKTKGKAKADKTAKTPETDKAAREWARQVHAPRPGDRPPRLMTDRFYLIPERLFKKLRILVLADVAYEKVGESMWDALANDMHEGFTDEDLESVRFSPHDALTREQAYKLGFNSSLCFC